MLILWRNSRDLQVVPILILDVYRMHMKGSIVNYIQALVIVVQYILAGCTYLCQSVNVNMSSPINTGHTRVVGRMDIRWM